jgi:outer membrane protein
MNTRQIIRNILLATSLASAPLAHAEDLAEVYQRALQSDPQIREAEANRLAALEAKPQALSALLPQLNADANFTDSRSDGIYNTVINTDPGGGTNLAIVSTNYNSEGDSTRWNLELRQSVFRWENWVALKRADSQVAQAEADYAAAQQELILRTSQLYFDALAAKDTLDAAMAAQEAIARQLEQAEKRFEVGLIAITDVQEAKAAFDTANAAVISGKRILATQVERLRELTGESFAELKGLGDDLPLRDPKPANVEDWVKLAMEQNLSLLSSRLAADISRSNISFERGGHLPTLDLVATRSGLDTRATRSFAGVVGLNGNADAEANDKQIMLQLTVPIYSGGGTSSRVRQAEYQHRAARERLERTARQTELDARDAYLGVMSEMARVKALKQALESARTALQATEAGYEVGTRTTVDVLEARRRLFDAQTNFSRSRYDFLLNALKLRLAAGMLEPTSVAEVNGWLVNKVSVKQ